MTYVEQPAPTQVRHPWTATLRTVVQVGIPALLTLGLIGPEIVEIILDQIGKSGLPMPSWVRPAFLGISAALTAIAGIITRIMAIPAVDYWLTRTFPALSATGRRDLP